ncbi:gas vesicle structural protein [Frankia sp. AiPs1]|uniref:gas vesicle protein n=1 Tax=Frankia sp. AiPa1 TaxID=573492 RepID=UPI00202B3215|nr:gas vesicle protein [Frankia sp. AiPa1]MCL9759725.1 gas vesicle protein [Frankia sp. AiPa1]
MTIDHGSLGGPPRVRALSRPRSDSLADVLERVLDKGVVIVGDIVISVLDVELLTLKLRLFIASADTAREMGLDWWTTDPFYSREARSLEQAQERELRTETIQALHAENEDLRSRLAVLESSERERLAPGEESVVESQAWLAGRSRTEAEVASRRDGPARQDQTRWFPSRDDDRRPFWVRDAERRRDGDRGR